MYDLKPEPEYGVYKATLLKNYGLESSISNSS